MKSRKREVWHFFFDTPTEEKEGSKILHPPRWIAAFLALWLLLSLFALAYTSGRGTLFCALFALMGITAIWELTLGRIRLLQDAMEIETALGRQRIDRADIASIKTGSDYPGFLELKNAPAYWLPLGFNNPAVTSIVQDWLEHP